MASLSGSCGEPHFPEAIPLRGAEIRLRSLVSLPGTLASVGAPCPEKDHPCERARSSGPSGPEVPWSVELQSTVTSRALELACSAQDASTLRRLKPQELHGLQGCPRGVSSTVL